MSGPVADEPCSTDHGSLSPSIQPTQTIVQTLTTILSHTITHPKMPTLTKLYTMEEASQHNTNEDCWVVIDGKVYDVSSYLDEHPGGDDVLLRATGKDSTEEFEDAGHSKTAREQMEQFCIGELEEMSPPIPEMEIVSKKQELAGLPQKVLNFSKQFGVAEVALISVTLGLGISVGLFYLRKKQNV